MLRRTRPGVSLAERLRNVSANNVVYDLIALEQGGRVANAQMVEDMTIAFDYGDMMVNIRRIDPHLKERRKVRREMVR